MPSDDLFNDMSGPRPEDPSPRGRHPRDGGVLDLAGFTARPYPNWCLAAPADALPGLTPHILTAALPMSPDRLCGLMARMLRGRPRTRIIAAAPDLFRIDAIQRSRIFRFTDDVALWAMPAGEGAAPVILSRSRIGRNDLGANRRRVESWLAALSSSR